MNNLELLKLYNKAFKTFPNSPKQKKIIEKIDKMKKLKKGSIEAKRYMAKIRSMRKTKKRKVNETEYVNYKDKRYKDLMSKLDKKTNKVIGKKNVTYEPYQDVFKISIGDNSKIQKMYLDYVNNFLSIDKFAEHYGITKKQAISIINKGKKINETSIGDYKHNKSQFFEAKKPKNPRKKRTRKQNEWKVSRTKSGRFKKGGITKLNGSIYGIVTGSKYSKLAQQLIIDNINTDDYGLKNATELEKIKLLKNTFESEYGWAVNRMGLQNAVESWLRGAPTIIDLPHWNDDIIAIAKQWGSLPQNATEKQEYKILNNYYRLMAANVVKLFRKIK